MLDQARISLVAEAAPPLPVASVVLGKSREEVAEVMPRLFNLCRAAQGRAARLALNLPVEGGTAALRDEILRDHVLRLVLVLPRHFGQVSVNLPPDWKAGGRGLRQAVFGPTGRLPDTYDDFTAYLAAGQGVATLWRRIDGLFAAGEASTDPLPYVSRATAAEATARVENSCAQRVADHPVLTALERTGRGPLWRVVARSYDLQALLDGAPLVAEAPAPGLAHVHATRGLYTVSAETEADRVTRFDRVTPTQHMVAPGGVLDQTIATLPVDRARLAPLVLDVLDPCSPIRIKERADA